ncbi:MAG: hypothetical protein EPN82_01305 [Bacteroidetes bacterium]|nr:MAG: hypothetical protein EPN82_01305 [Bacteroidota bacterium]
MLRNIIKKKRVLFIPLITVLIFLLVSCNDEPTYMGSSLLLDTISIISVSTEDTTLIESSNSFLYRLEIFNAGVMFLGKYNDLEAISMIRFSGIPDTLGSITEADIDSVTLTLPLMRYAYGDDTLLSHSLSFKVYKVMKYWTNKTNWDTIFPSGSTTDYFDTKVLGTFDGEISQEDEMKPMTLQIDKQLIAEWFKLSADSATAGTIWGIALVPDINSSVIRTLSAQAIDELRIHPYLRITYRKKQDTLDTLILQSAIDASVTNSNPPDENTLTVQGGISSRFKLSFDISIIPDEAAIHVAELDLHINKSASQYGNYNLDSTIAASLYLDSSYTSSFGNYYGGNDSNNRELYKFPKITSAVQYWVTHGKKGVLVFSPEGFSNEYREFDKMVFYGMQTPDLTKRPAMRIIYSTRPKFGIKK